MVDALNRVGLSEAVGAIHAARNIVLACHVNPDGDALGSLLGLSLALESLGKTVTPLSADGVPPLYSFLPTRERVLSQTDRRDFDLAIVVDAGDLNRTGSCRPIVEAAPVLMDIDHHVTGGVFGQVRLLDSTAAATVEILYDLLLALNAPITPDIATCFMVGLMTDTGLFRFPAVTARTMQIGGEMIRAGAVPDQIAECIYENRPFAAQKLLGCALNALQRSPDGRVVWSKISKADFAETGATDQDSEGIMNNIRTVQGSEISFLMREVPDSKIRVSLRAHEPWDVSLVATQFGGGGHRLAAGCTITATLAEAQAHLLEAIAAQLGVGR